MTNPDPHQDLIDMIAKATPDNPINEDHRERLRRQVLEAYDNRAAADAPATRNPLFTFKGTTVMKFAASIALLSVIAFFAVTTMSPSKALAFEDVAKAILKIDSVSFEASSVYHSGKEQMDAGVSYTCYMQFPDQVRVETPEKIVMIADVKANKMLLCFPGNQAILLDKLSEMGEGFGELDQPTNFISELQEQFRAAESGQGLGKVKYTKLGEKQIDGQAAVGYRIDDPEQAEFSSVEIWADAKTARPILIHYTHVIDDENKVVSTLKNFKYSQAFDAGLFSLTPPQGYQLFDANEGDIFDKAFKNLPQDGDEPMVPGTVEDLFTALAIHAVEGDGTFPATLTSGEVIDGLIAKWQKENPGKEVFKDGDKLAYTDPELGMVIELIYDSFAYVRKLEADGIKVEYAGKGVEVGDASPILWFKTKDAETYTVLYANQQIKQLKEAPAKP